jgi:transposase
MWIPPEDIDPVVLQEPTRKSVGVFGAVRISDGCLITNQEKTFNNMTFLQFLKKLLPLRQSDRKMVVILDNARWHYAKALTQWLTEHQEIFQLDFLPPYSPDLNHIERVWKLTRKLCTHNRYFATLDSIAETVFHQFDLWSQPNDTLRRLCAIN